MALALRAIATSQNSLTCNKPTGTVDTDVMLAYVRPYDTSVATIGAPAGWAQIGSTVYSANGKDGIAAFWKIAASEGASYTFTNSASSYTDISIISYSGPDQTTPVQASGGNANTRGTVTPATIKGLTTARNGAILVAAFVGYNGDLSGTPTGYASQAHWDSNWTIDQTVATAGTIADVTQAMGANDDWVTFTVALQPPASGAAFIAPRPVVKSQAVSRAANW